MGVIFKIGLRNLLRQKRRNIFLGTAIAIGMVILVLVSSFTKGLSDMVLNKWLLYSFGHIGVNFIREGKQNNVVIPDKDRFINTITNNLENVKTVNNYIAIYTRVIGNGRTEMMALVGMQTNDFIEWAKTEGFSAKDGGNPFDFTNSNIENPVVMAENKARDLNVKVGDNVRVALRTITGQVQTAKLTVVALMKSQNIMQSTAFYIPQHILKILLGYRPYESGPLQIILNKMDNPSVALREANKLYNLLKPDLAGYYGRISANGITHEATVLSFFTNTNSMNILKEHLRIVSGSLENATNSNTIIISSALARKLNLKINNNLTASYKNKFEEKITTNNYRVCAIYEAGKLLDENILLVSENSFYPDFYRNWPVEVVKSSKVPLPQTNSSIYPALATEWKLLPRTYTSEQFQKKMREVRREKWEGGYLDISTMYEAASMVLSIESGLNMVSMIAVLILFFVILIGVMNTLRMSIRERTREIGTVRAIGMQIKDVKNSFIVEVFLLALFACIAGIIVGIILMGILSLIPINTESMFSMFLYEKHLNLVLTFGRLGTNISLLIVMAIEFLFISLDDRFPKWIYPQWLSGLLVILTLFIGFAISASGNGIFTYLILIIQMLVAVAYFPARKAARISAAAALRHYE